jgi:hypothetical protein
LFPWLLGRKKKFSLNTVPTKSCFSKILRARDSIPSLEQLSELHSQRRSSVAPRIPELEEYLDSVILEHQRSNVEIAGPALKWLAKIYCLTDLHMTENQLPLFSTG